MYSCLRFAAWCVCGCMDPSSRCGFGVRFFLFEGVPKGGVMRLGREEPAQIRICAACNSTAPNIWVIFSGGLWIRRRRLKLSPHCAFSATPVPLRMRTKSSTPKWRAMHDLPHDGFFHFRHSLRQLLHPLRDFRHTKGEGANLFLRFGMVSSCASMRFSSRRWRPRPGNRGHSTREILIPAAGGVSFLRR